MCLSFSKYQTPISSLPFISLELRSINRRNNSRRRNRADMIMTFEIGRFRFAE
jgi:hypothetical protein